MNNIGGRASEDEKGCERRNPCRGLQTLVPWRMLIALPSTYLSLSRQESEQQEIPNGCVRDVAFACSRHSINTRDLPVAITNRAHVHPRPNRPLPNSNTSEALATHLPHGALYPALELFEARRM